MELKLFSVLYFAGQIAGSVGPLPYGEDECVRRMAWAIESEVRRGDQP